jgi:predicted NodU family carbamoyl transferase
MKILSINFGFNGSFSLLVDGKIIKHTSFHKINYGNDRNIIKDTSLSSFMWGADITLDEIDWVVLVGYKESDFNFDRVAFVPDSEYEISPHYTRKDFRLESKQVTDLGSLNPPFTKKPYDYIKGHFIYKDFVIKSYIISPDLSYNAYGYLTSNFTNSINITVSSFDETPVDGSVVSVSKGNNISIVNRPMISVGKLYPKITELLGFGLGYLNRSTLCDMSTRYNIPENLKDIIDEGVNNPLSKIKDNYELNFFFQHSTSQYKQDEKRHKQIPFSSFNVDDINSKYALKTAAITQRVIENTVIKLINESVNNYSGNFTHNITLSGSVFENRRLNTKILQTFPELNIHISPFNSEEVTSLGGALYVNMIEGTRRIYNRDFILSTSPYYGSYENLGDEINYSDLSLKLKTDLIGYKTNNPECTEKSYGYTGILFDVNSKGFINTKSLMIKNPFEKPVVLISEEFYVKHFNNVKYTYNNNTLSKPKKPHLFKEFIHDDGYVNLFVVNETVTPFLHRILKNTNNEYLGHYDFTSVKNKHINYIQTLFEISDDLDIKTLIIDNKIHHIE